jgi:hypothetical protein
MAQFLVSLRKEDGTFDKVGTNNRYITNDYKTLKGLLQHGISQAGKDRGYQVYDRHNVLIATNCHRG